MNLVDTSYDSGKEKRGKVMLLAWVWVAVIVIALGLSIFAVVWSSTKSDGGSRGRRGRIGPTGATGFGSSATTVSYIGFTVNDSNVLANTTGPVGSFVTYGTLGNLGLDPASVSLAGDSISIVATHIGFLQNLYVFLNPSLGGSTSTDPGIGMATIWKTTGCDTAFVGTPLSVSWNVPAGDDLGVHCASNTTDLVPIGPLDRFMLVFTATGGASVQYGSPASAGLEYAFA